MPDWSYHPLLRPALFKLPAESARDLTLAVTGSLALLPLGTGLIDLLGRMSPPDTVQCSAFGLSFSSPVGLGAGLDINGVALAAFAHFGFGFLEVGPVTLNALQSGESASRRIEQQAICYPAVTANQGAQRLVARLRRYGPLSIPLAIRLGYVPGQNAVQAAHERQQLIELLASYASFFVLDCQDELIDGTWGASQWAEHLAMLSETKANGAAPPRLLINLRPDLAIQKQCQLTGIALDRGIHGVVVGGGIRTDTGHRLVGAPTRELSLRAVRSLRAEFGDHHQLTIIGSGGIQQPQDALDFLEAGATLIQIHSGFVYSGPGLPKRINEAVAYYCGKPPALSDMRTGWPRLLMAAWFWVALLGVGLAVSGVVVWIVAVTRTVLPYDETFVGLTRAQLMAINPRLLPFMEHDRVTLAGTMLATGILYIGLALGGVRQGSRWARDVVSISAISGFLSFFLFLGFGYFDPIHASLTVGLLPLFVLGIRARLIHRSLSVAPNRTNNRRWMTGQWGQFVFVVVGFGLIMSGLAIITVGVAHVFVPEDLKFLNTTAEALSAANTHLLPLIAHDRVGFGGNLISVGLAVLLLSLWGFRQGERWVWWTLALAGLSGFVAAIGVHLAVGYLELVHLFPALLAIVLFVIGLIWSFPYLNYPER